VIVCLSISYSSQLSFSNKWIRYIVKFHFHFSYILNSSNLFQNIHSDWSETSIRLWWIHIPKSQSRKSSNVSKKTFWIIVEIFDVNTSWSPLINQNPFLHMFLMAQRTGVGIPLCPGFYSYITGLCSLNFWEIFNWTMIFRENSNEYILCY
jgi:hypothetical protein